MIKARHYALLSVITLLSGVSAWLWLATWTQYQENQRYRRETVTRVDQDRQHLTDMVHQRVKRHERPKTVREGWRRYVLLQDAIQDEATRAVDTAWAEICDDQDPVCRIVRLAQERENLLRWLRARHAAEVERLTAAKREASAKRVDSPSPYDASKGGLRNRR